MPIRVLILEDRALDAELMLHELHKAGFEPNWERVETETDFMQNLDSTVDLILADYNLPHFDAPHALKRLKQSELDIPFIVVSGTVGEEVAVEMMIAGAHDYLMKGNLKRLGPAVERELREAGDRRKRRWAEEQLRQSEERFARAFHASPIGISITTVDGLFLDVNDRFLELFGYSRDEVIGHTSSELDLWVDQSDRGRIEQLLRVHQSIREYETKYRTKSEDIRDILISIETITLGGEACVLSLFQDITERKQAEAELRALYNATSYLFKADNLLSLGHQIVAAVVREFEQADCGLMLVDRRQNSMIRLARAGEYDINPEVPLVLDGPGLVPVAVRSGKLTYAPDVTDQSNYVSTDARTRSELVVPLKTGKDVIAVLDLQSAELDAFSERDQRILLAFAERAAAAIEIVQLYEALNHHAAELEWRVAQRTAELQRAKDHFETILNNSSDVIILVDAHGVIHQVNPAFSQMFGTPDELSGQSLMSFIAPSQAKSFMDILGRVVDHRQPERVEQVCVRNDGSAFDADLALAPLTGDEADVPKIICSLRDISQRKQLELGLREALARERELHQLKSRFVSMVSHEFRTPLSVIATSSQLVRNYKDRMPEDKQLEHLDTIGSQVQRLTTMVDDILTIDKVDAKRVAFKAEQINLESFCREIVDELSLTAPTHSFHFAVTADCPSAEVDPRLIRQIVYNLLSNAVKYSPQAGNIHLELSCNEHSTSIRIADQGIGIPEADREHLFEAFHRAGNVGSIEGSGLGLAIVKEAVDAHKGSITVESELGKGTAFTVSVPLVQNTGAGG